MEWLVLGEPKMNLLFELIDETNRTTDILSVVHDTRKPPLLARLRAFLAGGPFCHVEVQVDGINSFGAHPKEGVRFAPITWTPRTVVMPVPVNVTRYAVEWALGECGCKYDHVGAFLSGIGLPGFPGAAKQAWTNAEIVVAFLERCGVYGLPQSLTVNELAILLANGRILWEPRAPAWTGGANVARKMTATLSCPA
jgi:hypothetical protein